MSTVVNPKLTQAIHDYYTTGESQLTDAEFDAIAPKDRPVGVKAATGFKKVKHSVPMLSLRNAFSAEEVVADLSGVDDVVAEFKFDGLSLSLTYEDGKLTRAATRGDGTTGDDVTLNAMQIPSIPHTIPLKTPVEVRGEVLMRKASFQLVNQKLTEAGDQPFSNPRNLAAGTMKSKDPQVVADRGLHFYAYILFPSVKPTQFECTKFLKTLKFLTPDQLFSSKQDNQTTLEYAQRKIGYIASIRDNLPFEIDGIVFKANSIKTQEELGETDSWPNWAVAYKFPPTQVKTTIRSITVQVGRQGTLTPVAEVDPTNLGGAIVKRATLCNIEQVERLGVGVGSEVMLARAADVIPQIVSCVTLGSHWQMPTECPSCSTQVVKIGAHTFCQNPNCPAQVAERLRHAFCKGALDVDGCGPAMIDRLIELGATTLSQALMLPDLGPDSAGKKVLAGFKACLSQPFWRKLNALGIELIGQSKCQDIALKYGNDINELLNTPQDQLAELIGPVAAQNFYDFVDSNIEELSRLGSLGYWFNSEANETIESKLTGKQLVITGTLVSGGRDEIADLIAKYGGVVKGGVNKKTDYLVVGFSPGAGKTTAAEKHGTKQITEEELYALMGIPMPEAKVFAEDV